MRIEKDENKNVVSRAENKLADFCEFIHFDFRGKTVLDIGSSTGGFTEYAILRGAEKVVAVEKGTKQMKAPLRFSSNTDMGAEGIFAEETDECAYLWQNEFNEETRLLRMDLSFYIKAPDGRYDRYEETHRQRAWRSGEIGQLLLESGLCDIAVLGSDAGDEKRIFFSAKKPE